MSKKQRVGASMGQVVFLASAAVWEHGHGPNHPLKPIRLQRTYELLKEYGAFRPDNVRLVAPRRATADELALFHIPEYIDVVRNLSQGGRAIAAHRYGFGSGDNPVFAGMYDSERLKAGSALQAAELLARGACDVAFSYNGGLHHGGADFAAGFCVFNDAAVAIHWLLQQGLRVAYVDIDVHHGDGVQAAFYDTDQVLTISLHQDGRTLFPGTGFINETGIGAGKGFSVNVPLPPQSDDETYLWAFTEIVPPLLKRFAADVVVTQLGVDTHSKDPLAQMALSTHGHEALFLALRDLSPRWLALGGGGYDMDVVPRAWALAFGAMSDQTFPDALPPKYQERYGGEWLHDRQRLQNASKQVRGIVAEIITAVKQQHDI